MTNKENNLTQFFTEYLSTRLGAKSELNAINIIMACYSALNSIDNSLNVAEVVFDMRNDFEYIYKVIDDLARNINKKEKAYDKKSKSESIEDYYTIPEIQGVYGISQQAIRKACNEGRLPFKEGQGKNKYLIQKADIDTYMTSAKGKKLIGVLDAKTNPKGMGKNKE